MYNLTMRLLEELEIDREIENYDFNYTDEIEHVIEDPDGTFEVVEYESNFLDNIVCLAIVTSFAYFCGFLIMLTRGEKLPWPFHNLKLNPLSKTIMIPPLIGMIIGGIISRNFFGPFMDNFNDQWGTYIRMICLSVILLEGGMELEFSAKGALTMVIVMTFVPFLSEAFTVASLA